MFGFHGFGEHAIGELIDYLPPLTFLPVSRTTITAKRPAMLAIGEIMGLHFASFSGPLATYTNPSTYNQLTIDTVEVNADNLAHLIAGDKIEIDIAGRYMVIASVGVYPSDYSTPFNGGIFIFLDMSLTYLSKGVSYVTAAGVLEDLITIPVGALDLADGDTLDLQMSIGLGTDADAYVYEVTLLKLEE